MSARDSILGRLLIAAYDHHGLLLDLYGTLEDGYQVRHACIPNTMQVMTVTGELLDVMSAHCDDTLPSAEELRETHRQEMRIDRREYDRAMARLPELTTSF